MITRLHGLESQLTQFCGGDVALWKSPQQDAASSTRLLQQVRRWLGQPGFNHGRIRQPQPDHSLTHAGGQLLAMAVRNRKLCGLGLDFEPWRELDERHQRLLLTTAERRSSGKLTGRDLLRIWTVKEACFKADRGGQQHWVTAYELPNPSRRMGSARVLNGRQVRHFRYISFSLATGILSAAFVLGDGHHEGH